MWPFQQRRLQAAGERSRPPCTKTHCTSLAGSSSLRQRLAAVGGGRVSHLFNLTRGFSKKQHKVAQFKKNDCSGNLLIKLLSYGSIKSKFPMRSLQAEKSNKGWNLINPEFAIRSSRPLCLSESCAFLALLATVLYFLSFIVALTALCNFHPFTIFTYWAVIGWCPSCCFHFSWNVVGSNVTLLLAPTSEVNWSLCTSIVCKTAAAVNLERRAKADCLTEKVCNKGRNIQSCNVFHVFTSWSPDTRLQLDILVVDYTYWYILLITIKSGDMAIYHSKVKILSLPTSLPVHWDEGSTALKWPSQAVAPLVQLDILIWKERDNPSPSHSLFCFTRTICCFLSISQPKKKCKCYHHQLRLRYASSPLWKHAGVSSARGAFELSMPSGSALGRTKIKVLDHTGHREGKYTFIKDRRSHTRLLLL